jgi:SET domain
MSEEETSHDVLYPTVTDDFMLSMGQVGLGIVATRKIKKGQNIMLESFEYMFGDVQEGDRLWLNRSEEAAKKGGKDLPTHIPLTRKMLLKTHGVPVIKPELSTDDEVVVSWHLEVPGMLINHSCDPNMLVDSHDCAKGEDYAARDIEVGEELTVDYCLQYYDRGPFFEKCFCGMEKCRGSMMGFKALTDAQKEEMLPRVSEAVKAMYLADIGKGPKVREELIDLPPRICMPCPTSPETGDVVKPMRIVFPGPSAGLANVSVKKCIDGDDKGVDRYALFASKDVSKGEMFYEFWWEQWPNAGKALIDMAFASQLLEEDPREGTVVRFDPNKSAAYCTTDGTLMFSGWQLLTTHANDPNVVYRNKEKYEKDNWQCVFATKDIKKGDLITMDWNCFIWDRNESGEALTDGDTNLGFKHLSLEAQNERKSMTWLHEVDPDDKLDTDAPLPCKALSPYVRACLQKVGCFHKINKDPSADEDSTSSSSSDSIEDADFRS